MLKELVQQPRCRHACKDSSCGMEGRGSPEDVLEGESTRSVNNAVCF